jgi:hypothetical protein
MSDKKTEDCAHLSELWSSLEAVSQELWQDNSKGALKLKIVVEEFRGEVGRLQEKLLAAQAGLQVEKRHVQDAMEDGEAREREIHEQNEALRRHSQAMEQALAKERKTVEELLKKIEAKEEENIDFKGKFLHIESERDHSRADKMQAFLQDVQKKETEAEETWMKRNQVLEAEYVQRSDEMKKSDQERLQTLQKRAADLEEQYRKKAEALQASCDASRREVESKDAAYRERAEALAHREAELLAVEKQAASVLEAKKRDLDEMKRRMEAELKEILREYQAKAAALGVRKENRA